MKNKMIKYLEEEGYAQDKFLVFNPELAEHAKSIPGNAGSCVAISDEDSMRYFDQIGFHVVSRKWSNAAGLTAMYDQYMENGKVKNEINSLPNLTPQEAFGEPNNTPAPPPAIPEIPLPPPTPEQSKEVVADVVMTIDDTNENKILYDADGIKRPDGVVNIIRELMTIGDRVKFLSARGYVPDSDNNCWKHEKTDAIIGDGPISNYIKGWDFYDYWKVQDDRGWADAKQRAEDARIVSAKIEDEMKKVSEEHEKKVAQVPEEIQEIAKQSENVVIASMPPIETKKDDTQIKRDLLTKAGFTMNKNSYRWSSDKSEETFSDNQLGNLSVAFFEGLLSPEKPVEEIEVITEEIQPETGEPSIKKEKTKINKIADVVEIPPELKKSWLFIDQMTKAFDKARKAMFTIESIHVILMKGKIDNDQKIEEIKKLLE